MNPSPEADYDPPLLRCPLCDSPRLRAWLVDFRGHTISRCRDCRVEFMNPQYSDAHLDRFYAGYINMHPSDRAEPWKRRKDPVVRATAKRRALDLLGTFVTGRRILMVGCGDGLELGVAKEAGWQVEGYDVDAKTTAEVEARLGVPVHSGAFRDLLSRETRYDVLFLDQVIEHVKDPVDYIATSHELVRDGGVLFLATPNIGSLSNRMKTAVNRLGLRRSHSGKHYNTRHHVFFFDPRVMMRLLRRRFGMEVLCRRASFKEQRNPVTALLGRWLPVLDSNFVVVARRPAKAGARAAHAKSSDVA